MFISLTEVKLKKKMKTSNAELEKLSFLLVDQMLEETSCNSCSKIRAKYVRFYRRLRPNSLITFRAVFYL
jgi:hypothetical protein